MRKPRSQSSAPKLYNGTDSAASRIRSTAAQTDSRVDLMLQLLALLVYPSKNNQRISRGCKQKSQKSRSSSTTAPKCSQEISVAIPPRSRERFLQKQNSARREAQEKRQRSIKDGLPLLRVAREVIKELNICGKDKLSSFSLPYELRFRHVSSDVFETFIAHLFRPMPLRQRPRS